MKEFLKRTKDTHKAKDYFLNEMAYTLGPIQLKRLLENELNEFELYDVRDYEDYIKSHIPFAAHLPHNQIEEQIENFSKDKIHILYGTDCKCHMAYNCAYILADHGYPVMTLSGGFNGWKKHDFDVIEDDMSDYPG